MFFFMQLKQNVMLIFARTMAHVCNMLKASDVNVLMDSLEYFVKRKVRLSIQILIIKDSSVSLNNECVQSIMTHKIEQLIF